MPDAIRSTVNTIQANERMISLRVTCALCAGRGCGCCRYEGETVIVAVREDLRREVEASSAGA